MTRNDPTTQTRDDREQQIVHIDPDFHVPAGSNSYLRALRILFPKAGPAQA